MAYGIRSESEAVLRSWAEFERRAGAAGFRDLAEIFEVRRRIEQAVGGIEVAEIERALGEVERLLGAVRHLERSLGDLGAVREKLAGAPEI